MKTQIPLAISSNIELTFESFYSTSSHQAILSELRSFSDDVSKEPYIFLWGARGSGISHLLSAVQNDNPAVTIQYLPLKECLQYPAADVLDGLDQLDFICIDDIDMIEGHSDWEESMFHLFNRLRDSGKRLLLGAHKSPAEINLKLPDLASRFQSGLILYMPPLSEQENIDALSAYAKDNSMELNKEVLNYLFQRTERSTKALFTLIKRLDHASLAEQRKLTLPFVKSILDIPIE